MDALFNPRAVREAPTQANPADTATATNADTVLTYGAPGDSFAHGVRGICVGFSATPAAPVAFTITDSVLGVVFQVQITDAGSQTFLKGCSPKLGSTGGSLTLTLPSGGSGVEGSISVGEHFVVFQPAS